jgi:phosphonopyruvate decarboxylase
MAAKEALVAVHAARREEDIVITTMSPARDWMMLPQHPRDLVLVPSAMSHATSIGLGLALAQPERRVIVCNGDGSMLMNLGSLVSMTAAHAENLVVLVFENGTYEVTGSQRVPGAGIVDYAGVARGAGFEFVYEFSDLAEWRREIGRVLGGPGPTFAVLHVEPVSGLPGPRSPGPAGDRAKRFMEALAP